AGRDGVAVRNRAVQNAGHVDRAPPTVGHRSSPRLPANARSDAAVRHCPCTDNCVPSCISCPILGRPLSPHLLVSHNGQPLAGTGAGSKYFSLLGCSVELLFLSCAEWLAV